MASPTLLAGKNMPKEKGDEAGWEITVKRAAQPTKTTDGAQCGVLLPDVLLNC